MAESSTDQAKAEHQALTNLGIQKTEIKSRRSRVARLRRRMRDPFNKQRVKKLKEEVEHQKKVNHDVAEALESLLLGKKMVPNLQIGLVETLQIDCKNITNGEPETAGKLQELLNETKEKFEKMIGENEELKQNIEKIKNSLTECMMKSEETKDILAHHSAMFAEHGQKYSQALENVQHLIEEIQNGKSDEQVFKEGASEIREGCIKMEDYEFLPIHAKHLVSRLVNRLGPGGYQALCQTLNVTSCPRKDGDPSDDDRETKTPLTKMVCTKILLEWMNRSAAHDGQELLKLLKTRDFKDSPTTQVDKCKKPSNSLDSVQNVTVPAHKRFSVCATSSSDADASSLTSSGSFNQHIIAKEPFDRECFFSNSSLENERLQMTNKYGDVVSV